ncbi:MAG: 16S rRNA (cytosine(1402)-N(4))-methyltransferase RsmH [Acetobacteraceae bacterium]
MPPTHGEAGVTHIPVMPDEVLAFLSPRNGGIYLDATFGGGGHTALILEAAACTVVAIDRDPAAIMRGAALAARYPGRLTLIEGRFSAMLELLGEAGVTRLDGGLMDFGVSSFQLEEAERGFSFRLAGPLDMRMGREGPTAATLVNTLTGAELATLLAEYGEEPHAKRIARAVVRARTRRPIATTTELAGIIRSVVSSSRERIDPATRSFQALRIRVNDELAEIGRGLAACAALLLPGGRLVAIAFHSLEDRLVKRFMAEAAGRVPQPSRHAPPAVRETPRFRLLTPRAIRPTPAEVAANPRASSARLRAVECLAPAA